MLTHILLFRSRPSSSRRPLGTRQAQWRCEHSPFSLFFFSPFLFIVSHEFYSASASKTFQDPFSFALEASFSFTASTPSFSFPNPFSVPTVAEPLQEPRPEAYRCVCALPRWPNERRSRRSGRVRQDQQERKPGLRRQPQLRSQVPRLNGIHEGRWVGESPD
jgi:hypothetical protein